MEYNTVFSWLGLLKNIWSNRSFCSEEQISKEEIEFALPNDVVVSENAKK